MSPGPGQLPPMPAVPLPALLLSPSAGSTEVRSTSLLVCVQVRVGPLGHSGNERPPVTNCGAGP